jgi:hypothetical protein
MPSETTALPGPPAPVVEAGSSGDLWTETGESRQRVSALRWTNSS